MGLSFHLPVIPSVLLLLVTAAACGDDAPALRDTGLRDTGARDGARDSGAADTGLFDGCRAGAMCEPAVECQEGRTTCEPMGCEVTVPAGADTACATGTCDGFGACIRTEDAMWNASDASMFDAFGGEVAIDGDYAVIGVGSATGGVYADAAYVFERDAGGNWAEVSILSTDDVTGGSFATAVDIEGTTLVIGTHGASRSGLTNAGAVYVYSRGADESWALSQTLVPSDPTSGQRFGRSVSIGGGRIAVGAYGAPGIVPGDGGVVYVFEESSMGAEPFVEVGRLTAADGDEGDALGLSVDIDGAHLIAGAPLDDSDRGAAYLFVRRETAGGGVWTEEARLRAADGAAGDAFGRHVALDGDRVAVSAPFADEAALTNSGAVYLFERQADMSVMQSQRLIASDGAGESLFGALALDGDLLVIGAPGHDRIGRSEMGIAYVFDGRGGAFTETAQIYRHTPEVNDRFGAAVAISGTAVLIGAPGVDLMMAEDVGGVFIFDLAAP